MVPPFAVSLLVLLECTVVAMKLVASLLLLRIAAPLALPLGCTAVALVLSLWWAVAPLVVVAVVGVGGSEVFAGACVAMVWAALWLATARVCLLLSR